MGEWSILEIIFISLLLLLGLGRFIKRQSKVIDILFLILLLISLVIRVHLINQSHLLKNKVGSLSSELEGIKENTTGLSVRGDALVINVKEVALKHFRKANEFLSNEEYDKALKELKYLVRLEEIGGESEVVHNNIALCYYKTGDPEKAKEHYQKALEINSSYYTAWNNLGVIYLETWKLDDAEYNFSKALEIKPDFEMAKNNLAKVFNNKGALHMKNSQLDEARIFFSKALELNPTFETAKENLRKLNQLTTK